MPRDFGRNDRVASEMQKELALILQRDIDDKRLGFVTINEVVLSKDLAVAKAYFTVLNASEQDKKNHQKWLNDMAPMIRHLLAKKMRLRHMSELKFFYDMSFETGLRVEQLLSEIHSTENKDKAD